MTTKVLEKDNVNDPTNGAGRLYSVNGGLWPYVEGEVISSLMRGTDKLSAWLPVRGVDYRYEQIKHLVYVGPADFTGEDSIATYLNDIGDPDACDFSEIGTQFNGFTYQIPMSPLKFKGKDTLTRRDGGLRNFINDPMQIVRGENMGLSIATDEQWILGRFAYVLEEIYSWINWFGNAATISNTYDGIAEIIRPGYVQSHIVGPGQADFGADPIFVSGLGIGGDPATLLSTIQTYAQLVLNRAKDRGFPLAETDVAIWMSPAHWELLSDYMAKNGYFKHDMVQTDITVFQTVDGIQAQLRAIRTGGAYGEGFIELPTSTFRLGVITENKLGVNRTYTDDDDNVHNAVVGDIYILTRRFMGMNILEHQYLNWDLLRDPGTGLRPRYLDEYIEQNGMFRRGWIVENNTCWVPFVESEHRIVTRYQPLQARITDITVETLRPNYIEAASFVHPDWYAFGGSQGGNGDAILGDGFNE